MAKSYPTVNTSADGFLNLVTKINSIITFANTEAVSANTTGAVTSGNGFVNGVFGSNTLVATTLSGGNTSAAGTLTIVANGVTLDTILAGNSTVNLTANSTTINVGAGKFATVNSTTVGVTSNVTVGANVSINTSTLLIGTSSLDTVGATVGNSTNKFVANTTVVAVVGDTKTLTVGNSTINSSVNSTTISIDTATVNTVDGAIAVLVGDNVSINTSSAWIGNSTVNAEVTSTSFNIKDATGITKANTSHISVGNSTVNTSANSTVVTTTSVSAVNVTASDTVAGAVGTYSTRINVGSNIYANATHVFLGNSTINALLTSDTLELQNSTTESVLTRSQISVGNSTVNTVANSSTVTTGTVAATLVGAGANVYANVTHIFVGNSTVNTVANSSAVVTNSGSFRATANVGSVLINTTSVSVGANVVANLTALYVGNSTVNSVISGTGVTTTRTVTGANLTSTDTITGANVALTGRIAVGANVYANLTHVYAGNSISTTTLSNTGFYVGNSTSNTVINSTAITVEVANFGTANITVTNIETVNSTNATFQLINVGADISVNTTTIKAGTSVTNTTSVVADKISATTTMNVGGVLMNTIGVVVGQTVVNTTTVFVGNSTTNSIVTDSAVVTNTGTFRTQVSVGANVYANVTHLFVGNTTVNALVNSSTVDINYGKFAVRINVGSNVYGNLTSVYVGNSISNTILSNTGLYVGNSTSNSTVNSTTFSGTANNADYLGGVAAANYQTEAGLAANVATMTANDSNYLGGTVAGAYLINTDSRTLSGNLVLSGANVVFSSQTKVGANVIANTTTVFVGNSTVNSVVGVGTVTSTRTVTAANLTSTDTISGANVSLTGQIAVGADVYANQTTVFVGNSTVNSIVSVGNVTAQNSDFTAALTPRRLTVSNSTYSSYYDMGFAQTSVYLAGSRINVGSNVYLGTSSLFLGNATVNTIVNSSAITTGIGDYSTGVNVGSNVYANVTHLFVGNSTVNTVANSSAVVTDSGSFRTTANIGSVIANTTSVSVGANVYANLTTLYVGNSTIRTSINSTQLYIANGSAPTDPVSVNITPAIISLENDNGFSIETANLRATSLSFYSDAFSTHSNIGAGAITIVGSSYNVSIDSAKMISPSFVGYVINTIAQTAAETNTVAIVASGTSANQIPGLYTFNDKRFEYPTPIQQGFRRRRVSFAQSKPNSDIIDVFGMSLSNNKALTARVLGTSVLQAMSKVGMETGSGAGNTVTVFTPTPNWQWTNSGSNYLHGGITATVRFGVRINRNGCRGFIGFIDSNTAITDWTMVMNTAISKVGVCWDSSNATDTQYAKAVTSNGTATTLTSISTASFINLTNASVIEASLYFPGSAGINAECYLTAGRPTSNQVWSLLANTTNSSLNNTLIPHNFHVWFSSGTNVSSYNLELLNIAIESDF